MQFTFTDHFIKRPVLSIVISCLIFLFGLRAIYDMPLRQYPNMENTVISVTTMYPGANADLIQGFITTPLQKVIASADGIDYLVSESIDSGSIIKAYVKLNFNPSTAFTNVMSKVSEARGELPKESEPPIVKKETGSQIALMYMSFTSDAMSPEQITDYISRVVQPKIETVTGVAQAEILGGSTFAMRIWLDPQKMAALYVTPTDVVNALQKNNFQSAAGKTKGEYVAFSVSAQTDLHDVGEFNNIVVKSENGILVRLEDIASIKLGSQNYDSSVFYNGKQAIFIGVKSSPSANPLTVITKVKALLPDLKRGFPPSMEATAVYDATEYIRASIKEVIHTIIEATLIVVLVIFLFLGAPRSVLIPVVTIPLSLVGVCSLMLALGYSINLLTLLAMVLAIGLVVDDAIVVVENVHRHIEEGLSSFDAAIKGAREIALPVISMTITLAAVYAPIGFMSGINGALFKEFAFTLASSVIISGIIALTLSPMMASKILRPSNKNNRFEVYVNQRFNRLRGFYQRKLENVLDAQKASLCFIGFILLSCYLLYANTPQQLAPDEDQSIAFVSSTAPQYANLDYVTRFTGEFKSIFEKIPEMEGYFIINGMGAVNNVISGAMLKPWDQRKRSQAEVIEQLQGDLGQVAGLNTAVFPLPSLPTGDDGLPLQFVLTTTASYELLFESQHNLMEEANKSGLFMFIDGGLKFNKPELQLKVNSAKAAELGITMQDIGNALAISLGGNYVNRFSMEGRSYQVIPQLKREYRYNPEQIRSIYIKTASGHMVPLSTVVSIGQTVKPNKLTQFQQLNAATIQGMMMPGKTIGEGLAFLQEKATEILPKEIGYDYAGQSRQFMQEGNTLVYTFFFALIVIFLLFAAQFESFTAPLIILISVPMSVCGALIPLNLGMASINIYTQVGLITLIGLISKHGILMVDYANSLLRTENLSVRKAIEKAAAVRLRPILMTTSAMIFGVLPLVFASGAGAVSRFNMGLVIATGMLFGTVCTLFVVPTMYTLLTREGAQKPIKFSAETVLSS